MQSVWKSVGVERTPGKGRVDCGFGFWYVSPHGDSSGHGERCAGCASDGGENLRTASELGCGEVCVQAAPGGDVSEVADRADDGFAQRIPGGGAGEASGVSDRD